MNLESKLRTAAVTSTAQQQKNACLSHETRGNSDPKKPGAPIQQAKVYDVNMKITGVAFTDVQVAQFITRLNTFKVFKDVNLLISDEFKDAEGGQQLRKFQRLKRRSTLMPRSTLIRTRPKPRLWKSTKETKART